MADTAEDTVDSRSSAAGDSPPVPERLLTAASRLFAERGFERTSVQELVDAAGVTKGAMYHYFASKEDLLFALHRRLLATQIHRLKECEQAGGPVRERLRAAAVSIVETTVENLDDTVVHFRSVHMLSPERQNEVQEERCRYHERFRGLIEEGRNQGAFRTDVPADIIVGQYFGAVRHLGMWYRPGGELSGTDVGGYFAELLLSELRPA